jgi:hypothetical protein
MAGNGLCLELGYQRVNFECDSLMVVSAFMRPEPCWTAYGQLIEDTKIKLNSLGDRTVRHVCREVNTTAHIMAKFAISQMLDRVWIEQCSYFIQNIVLAEQKHSDS